MTTLLSETFQVLLILAVLCYVADFFCVFWIFERICKLLFERYRDHWKSYGSPPGILWRPPQSQPFSWPEQYAHLWQWNWLLLVLLFSTPVWLRQDPKARNLIRWLRMAAFTWLLMLPAIVAVVKVAASHS